ncbi:hypothetical protein MBT84_40055 [Streptomyces sp. MBT84]|nr:hypothetical protein [Streptomyces sp. MBT84]
MGLLRKIRSTGPPGRTRSSRRGAKRRRGQGSSADHASVLRGCLTDSARDEHRIENPIPQAHFGFLAAVHVSAVNGNSGNSLRALIQVIAELMKDIQVMDSRILLTEFQGDPGQQDRNRALDMRKGGPEDVDRSPSFGEDPDGSVKIGHKPPPGLVVANRHLLPTRVDLLLDHIPLDAEHNRIRSHLVHQGRPFHLPVRTILVRQRIDRLTDPAGERRGIFDLPVPPST